MGHVSKPGWIELRSLRASVVPLLRSHRECSLSKLLALLTLAEEGELSTLAIVRRLAPVCGANVRQLLASLRHDELVVSREDVDGKWWTLTENGWGLVARAVKRMGGGGYERDA